MTWRSWLLVAVVVVLLLPLLGEALKSQQRQRLRAPAPVPVKGAPAWEPGQPNPFDQFDPPRATGSVQAQQWADEVNARARQRELQREAAREALVRDRLLNGQD